jgi:hypothetical protein
MRSHTNTVQMKYQQIRNGWATLLANLLFCTALPLAAGQPTAPVPYEASY